MSVDPRTPCLVGVGTQTWHPDDVGDAGAPEPLEMWETVTRAAAGDTGLGQGVLDRLDAIDVVYCQTWQYDDAPARLADRLGVSPRRKYYSGIGGTTPQVLVQETAERVLRGELDVALVVGAEALATQRRYKKRGERYPYSFKPDEKRPFPWEAPFHPAEVAHEVFQAWLTFAIFDNARRAHLGVPLDEYRAQLGEQWERFTRVAAANPEAWFPIRRSAEEIITAGPSNRMVGYPYTKYMVSIMDVDMAGALLMTSHETADALGVAPDRRVYLRGWCYATDPVYVAEHVDLWRSPAMATAAETAMGAAGVGVDDVAHLDLYSCFGSSVNFARDALGIGPDDARPLTVTGGLPYHGGAGSDYLTHSIATMARVLRDDPGAYGMVSGVGMHMTKHVFGVYSTDPGPAAPRPPGPVAEQPACAIRDTYAGPAAVAAYSIVHGADGGPEWGVAVCDTPGGERCYARLADPDLLDAAEKEELVGRTLTLSTEDQVNVARMP
jgi:acetyl-CoA C-acetyltransferase